jgi:hypothetical protein
VEAVEVDREATPELSSLEEEDLSPGAIEFGSFLRVASLQRPILNFAPRSELCSLWVNFVP